MEISKQAARAGPSTVSSELGVQENSVLAKYIERFRHGQPQSREERRQMAPTIEEEQLPFWWMSPSSLHPSSTPTKATDKDVIQPLKDDDGPAIFNSPGQHQHDRLLSPGRGSLNNLSDISQCEFDDTDIQHLQERASRILLRGEFPLSDESPPVSSEGLGCSDFSSPVSIDEPPRRPLIPSLTTWANDSVQAVSSQKSAIPSLVTPTRPEQDILFQWRLRRKMEQAAEWPQSVQHYSLHGSTFPNLSHHSASGQAYKKQQSTQSPEFSHKLTATDLHVAAPQPETEEAHRLCSPASPLVCQHQTISHVPAHMHLLCDVLPCPIQSSHGSAQQNISQTPVQIVRKKTKVRGNLTEEPTLERVSPSTPASCGAAQGECHQIRPERNRKEKTQIKESDKYEKKTATSIKKQKKLTRHTVDSEHPDEHCATNRSSHQVLPRKVIPWAEQHRQQGSPDFPSKSCTGDHGPSSSLQSALGQVVSEVLFPKVDSSPPQMSPVCLVSPPRTATAPPRSPLPPRSAPHSVEVISQLLQEAEDSDEKEFDDDLLLQVLRKQRKWVKEQISEVDSMLNKILEEKQVI